MPMESHFLEGVMQEIASYWEPTREQKEAAKRSQNALREALDSETRTISARIVDHYLSGSYARHTAITPIDDVDIIFIIDPQQWDLPLFSDYPDPAKVLGTFERAIRGARGSSSIKQQRRSVRLSMNALDIDVVPAIQTDDEEFVMIPDKSEDTWLRTAPKCHQRVGREVNQKRNGLFIPLVKILKGWNCSLPDTAYLKSFAVETMAVRIFRKTPFESLFDGALLFFDFLCGRFAEQTIYNWNEDFEVGLEWSFSYSLPDIAGTGSNLLNGVSEERRTAFLSAALKARDSLDAATRARSEERSAELVEKALRV